MAVAPLLPQWCGLRGHANISLHAGRNCGVAFSLSLAHPAPLSLPQ